MENNDNQNELDSNETTVIEEATILSEIANDCVDSLNTNEQTGANILIIKKIKIIEVLLLISAIFIGVFLLSWLVFALATHGGYSSIPIILGLIGLILNVLALRNLHKSSIPMLISALFYSFTFMVFATFFFVCLIPVVLSWVAFGKYLKLTATQLDQLDNVGYFKEKNKMKSKKIIALITLCTALVLSSFPLLTSWAGQVLIFDVFSSDEGQTRKFEEALNEDDFVSANTIYEKRLASEKQYDNTQLINKLQEKCVTIFEQEGYQSKFETIKNDIENTKYEDSDFKNVINHCVNLSGSLLEIDKKISENKYLEADEALLALEMQEKATPDFKIVDDYISQKLIELEESEGFKSQQAAKIEEQQQAEKKAEEELMSSLQVAYDASDWEGVISISSEFISKYPDSENIETVKKYKADAHINIETVGKQALATLEPKYDKVQDITWYHSKNEPTYANDTSGIFPYIGMGASGEPWLRVRMIYTGDDWVFFDGVTVNVDGVNYTKSFNYYEVVRDNGAGDVWEYVDFEPTEADVNMLKAIANSSETIIRFQGDEYKYDHVVTQNEKDIIKNVLASYDYLKSTK